MNSSKAENAEKILTTSFRENGSFSCRHMCLGKQLLPQINVCCREVMQNNKMSSSMGQPVISLVVSVWLVVCVVLVPCYIPKLSWLYTQWGLTCILANWFWGVIIFYLTGGCGRNGMKDSVKFLIPPWKQQKNCWPPLLCLWKFHVTPPFKPPPPSLLGLKWCRARHAKVIALASWGSGAL